MDEATVTIPRRRITTAQEPVQRTAGLPEGAQPIDPAQFVDATAEEKVTVTIPREFHLTLDTGSVIRYKAGVDEMPLSQATHWFAKSMGVEVYNPATAAE